MYAYRTPGTYFEWLDTRPPTVTPLRTDIAGFVGIAARGPLHRPVRVESWTQFITTFGAHIPQGYLAYAVEGFFANGGQTCWIVRVADPAWARPAMMTLKDESQQDVLRLEAISPGAWGNAIAVRIIRGEQGVFSLYIRRSDGLQEIWSNVTLQRARNSNGQQPHPRFIETILNDPGTGSQFVRAQSLLSPIVDPTEPIYLQGQPEPQLLAGGSDGLAPAVELVDGYGRPILQLTTRGSLPYGQTISGSVEVTGDIFKISLRLARSGQAPELFDNLTMTQASQDYRNVETVLNDRQTGSRLVTAQILAPATDGSPDPPRSQTFTLSGGLKPEHFSRPGLTPEQTWGLATLEKIDEVSILAMPDIMHKPVIDPGREPEPACCGVLTDEPPWPPVPTAPLSFPPRFDDNDLLVLQLQGELISQCEKLKDRFAILDLRFEDVRSQTPLRDVVGWRNNYDTRYSALYYPWLGVPDPLALAGLLRTVPPSGHIAGVYARVDRQRGVHKPPANEILEGVKRVSNVANDRLHGDLNEENVNVVRPYNGRGIRIAGARTLSRDPDPTWRYINIRRLFIMIAEAIDEGTQWTVFEPNNPLLWADIERVIRSFLRGLWERGMLDGATAADAFSVRCDATTNPPEEIDQGRVICEVGLNPPWPAEFVIVRIGKTEGGIEILDEMRA